MKKEKNIILDNSKIKALRKKMCLSRAMLAERSHGMLSEATIKRAEAGHAISSRKIHDFADVFKVPVEAILISSQPGLEHQASTEILEQRILN